MRGEGLVAAAHRLGPIVSFHRKRVEAGRADKSRLHLGGTRSLESMSCDSAEARALLGLFAPWLAAAAGAPVYLPVIGEVHPPVMKRAASRRLSLADC
jgi:hypothetical protein